MNMDAVCMILAFAYSQVSGNIQSILIHSIQLAYSDDEIGRASSILECMRVFCGAAPVLDCTLPRALDKSSLPFFQ